jgi:hypothetical protein
MSSRSQLCQLESLWQPQGTCHVSLKLMHHTSLSSLFWVVTAKLQGSDTTVFSLSVNQDVRLYAGVHKFSENLGIASKFLARNIDRNQVPHWGPTSLQWPVNLTVMWGFLLGACAEILHHTCHSTRRNSVARATKHPALLHSCLYEFFARGSYTWPESPFQRACYT